MKLGYMLAERLPLVQKELFSQKLLVDFSVDSNSNSVHVNKFFEPSLLSLICNKQFTLLYCLSTNSNASCKFLNGCHSGLVMRSECQLFDLCHRFICNRTDYKCLQEMSNVCRCFELS